MPLDASAPPRKLNGKLAAGGDVRSDFSITADGQRAVYLAEKAGDEVYELFGARLDVSANAVRYNPALPAGAVTGDVTDFRVAASEDLVVYRADQDQDDSFDLYLARTDGQGHPRRMSTGGDALPDVASIP